MEVVDEVDSVVVSLFVIIVLDNANLEYLITASKSIQKYFSLKI